ncbi:substrate-binding periplasmic protein [Chitinimonas sp.]|uniref:substrate-binding periplasmic protein n=1 Tax=Chitinimonas sp. TaxID=1934313 RepID=UPI0035B31A1D
MRQLLVACLSWAFPVATWGLTLLTEDYPPFNMLEQNEVGGIASHIVREGLKRAAIDGQFQLLPWARAQMQTRSQADTCMYSAVRTAEREPNYVWIGPLVDDKIALFARADWPHKLGSMAEARKYQVGSYLGDAYGDYVERQGVTLDRAPADANNLPKLMSNRIDLWVAGSISGAYRASRLGLSSRIKQVFAAGDPKDTQMWLACNLAIDPDVYRRLNTAIHSVLDDGTAAAIAARYR